MNRATKMTSAGMTMRRRSQPMTGIAPRMKAMIPATMATDDEGDDVGPPADLPDPVQDRGEVECLPHFSHAGEADDPHRFDEEGDECDNKDNDHGDGRGSPHRHRHPRRVQGEKSNRHEEDPDNEGGDEVNDPDDQEQNAVDEELPQFSGSGAGFLPRYISSS